MPTLSEKKKRLIDSVSNTLNNIQKNGGIVGTAEWKFRILLLTRLSNISRLTVEDIHEVMRHVTVDFQGQIDEEDDFIGDLADKVSEIVYRVTDEIVMAGYNITSVGFPLDINLSLNGYGDGEDNLVDLSVGDGQS